MTKSKMGRPTDNPKRKRISVRLDAECEKILTAYCGQENVKGMEAVRRGIKKLKGELKK